MFFDAEGKNIEDEEEADDTIGQIKHQPTKHYNGMLEYKKDDEQTLIKHLVLELKPRTATTLIPTLPAYILFMCLRHTDYLNEDSRCKSLLTNTINGIKKVAKVRQLLKLLVSMGYYVTVTLHFAFSCPLILFVSFSQLIY